MAETDLPGPPRPRSRPSHGEADAGLGNQRLPGVFQCATDESDPTYVMLPTEHLAHTKGKCGLLRKRMSGTRAAADSWHQQYFSFLKDIGFVQGVASPCSFVHKFKNLAASVHGDDFTTVGPKCGLDCLETFMENKCELRKGGRLGPGKDDAKEILVLNRVIPYTSEGLEYEADPQRLFESLGSMRTANPRPRRG